MANNTPPAFDLNKGIYVPQLTEEFKISESAAYDYYSTNSGMFPKNPGGGGGGGGDTPSEEITGIKNKMNNAATVADSVSDNYNSYNNPDDILDSVIKLKKSIQELQN